MSWGALLRSRKVWVWAALWLATRFLIVAHVGFWNDALGAQWEDVGIFNAWSDELGRGVLPVGEAWQYPPGAGLLLVLPRVGWAAFGYDFVATMLILDLVGLVLLARLGQREGSDAGVWVWLLAMPMLRALPVLRFDLAPTVLAIGALLAIHRRPGLFGALAGVGAMVKAWPIALLYGEWDRGRLLRAAGGAAAAIAFIFVLSAFSFSGDQLGFLKEESGRGLQVESVASLPWHLRQYVTGQEIDAGIRYGAWEIEDHGADVTAGVLKWLSLAALIAAGFWWLARSRAIRRGREALARTAVSRDFAFTVVLLLVVTSRVLSPQYMIWMLGLSAVVLTARGSSLRRPAWTVVGAAVLTTAAYGPMGAYGVNYDVYGPAFLMLIRNVALIVAALDATWTMLRLLPRGGPAIARAAAGE